jgi:mono/diheme cytochrome c family protein
VTAELGTGGEGLSREDGFPGEVWAPNITPLKLAEWTDGEIARAITSGVSRDGRPLFPFMPYEMYANLSREDVAALVAWVRTLPSRPGRERPHELDFPLNLIVRLMPKEAVLRPTTPRPGDEDYGEYLTSVSGCQLCHTPEEGHAPVPGMEFAGGYEFPLASGRVVSANITPDQLTGIGVWTRDAFIARFRSYAEAEPATLDSDAPNTVMPWVLFAGMTDEDLGAIYDYLRTVPALEHRVEKWPDADSGL